ncbi:MAG TPA: TonB-dependent receptor [archaeon]|nr:TonB-dependent receptor [archaeon]
MSKDTDCLVKKYMILLVAVLSLCWWMAGFAQLNTGKIEGTIRDKDTGQPLASAQVVVKGTRLGNVSNADGYYFILNVPPGLRDITFTYTGYQKTTVARQLILAGQTTTVDAVLSSTIVELEGITVEGESEVLIPRDNTVSKQRMTSERIAESPATKLEDLIVLEAGVQIGGEGGLARGVRIRGGRLGEEAMVVDGIVVRNHTANPFRSGYGWLYEQELGSLGEDTTPLEVSTSSVEQVDIITGGFQAEYGNAQSGIINIVTREGGAEFKGNVRFTTDEQNPRTADYGYNQLQASLGGPVNAIPNLFYHISGEIQGMADRSPTHADEGFRGINQDFVDHLNDAVRNDPVFRKMMPVFTLEELRKGREFYAGKTGKSAALWSPLNPVRQPGNWMDRTLAAGKITYSPVERLKLIVSQNFSRDQNSYPYGYFNNGYVTKSQFPLRDWSKDADTTLFVPQSNARRTRTSNLVVGFNWDFLAGSQRSASLQFRFNNLQNQDINNASQKTNYTHETTFMSWSAHDAQFEVESYPNREIPLEPEEKHYLPDGDVDWRHDWRVETPFTLSTGSTLYWLSYRYLREHQYNYKADLDFQFNRHNRAKLGFMATYFQNDMFYSDGMKPRRDLSNEFKYEPRMYSAYIQNRTDLGDFVIDYGIRYDTFSPRANWGFRYGDQWGQDYFPKNVNELSPRLDVAFPVTDKSQLRFAYGVFTQLPSMAFIFSGENPGNLEYSRTDAFEAGLSYLVSQDMVLDLAAYYRDVIGNVALKEFFRDYWQYYSERRIREYFTGYTNRDDGNIKGVDLTLKRRFSNNFAFDLIYTLQFSRTTGSQYNSTSTWGIFIDPATGERFQPPDEIRPIDGDVTHKMSFHFNYLFPEDFQAGTHLNMILKNLRAFAIFSLQSGSPLVDRIIHGGDATEVSWLTRSGGDMVGGLNYFRGRWDYNLDLRLSKTFYLGASRRLGVFGEIFNVLNKKTNTPYPQGYTYESRSGITGGVDLVWSDNLIEEHKVRFNADFNQDGILSVMEATKGSIASSVMSSTMNHMAWGRARQIRCGLDFSF